MKRLNLRKIIGILPVIEGNSCVSFSREGRKFLSEGCSAHRPKWDFRPFKRLERGQPGPTDGSPCVERGKAISGCSQTGRIRSGGHIRRRSRKGGRMYRGRARSPTRFDGALRHLWRSIGRDAIRFRRLFIFGKYSRILTISWR